MKLAGTLHEQWSESDWMTNIVNRKTVIASQAYCIRFENHLLEPSPLFVRFSLAFDASSSHNENLEVAKPHLSFRKCLATRWRRSRGKVGVFWVMRWSGKDGKWRRDWEKVGERFLWLSGSVGKKIDGKLGIWKPFLKVESFLSSFSNDFFHCFHYITLRVTVKLV
jgi:hypothetical protein